MNALLKVGVGRKIITPKIGANLYGYGPNTVSTSVNDDLTVTAVAFQYENTKVLMISATVCLIQTELANDIRTIVEKQTSIPFSNVIISATHTHSGPNTAGQAGWGDIDANYCSEIFIPQITEAAKDAVTNLKPAKLGIGTTESFVGINRREIFRDNTVGLGQNHFGCFDKTMTVLSFTDTCGNPIVNIINYGAHGTAAGCNTEISRDWPGIMTDILEKESGAVTVFFNGAEGDVGPRLSNGKTTADITYVAQIGALAGFDAVRAYKNIKEYSNVSLKCITDKIKIPYSPKIPLKDAEAKLSALSDDHTNYMGQFHQYYQSVIDAYKNNQPNEDYLEIDQTLITVGQVAFIPFSYEVFSQIALRLRTYSKYAYTLSLSNTNGNRGYLPSQDQICREGYEVRMFKTGNVQKLADNADYYFISENLRLLEELKCTE